LARGLSEAISAVLASGLPGQRRPTRVDIDQVLAVGWPPSPGTAKPSAAKQAAALAWSLGRSGQARTALTAADRYAMPLLTACAAQADPLDQARSYAALAETYLLHGHLAEAATCAQFSADYAEGSAADEFRAAELRAAAEALNGEFTAAGGAIGTACETCRTNGWGCGTWPVTIAVTQIGFRTGNVDQCNNALESLAAAAEDPVERSVVRLCRAWTQAAAGNHEEVVSSVDTMLRAVDSHQIPPFLLDLAISIKAMALAHLGQPGPVLELVEGRQSPSRHAVCFEVLAASAYLQLREPRKVLQVTEPCLRSHHHSLRTFPSVLLRRAVANELLGHTDMADADFSQATHLAVDLAGIRPALGLPLDILERLYNRLLEREPALREKVTARIPAAAGYSQPEPMPFDIGVLTKREKVLAAWLSTDLTFVRIAAELCVSTNTVKTQARSVYHKLGASGRAEATEKLERAGLHLGRLRAETADSIS